MTIFRTEMVYNCSNKVNLMMRILLVLMLLWQVTTLKAQHLELTEGMTYGRLVAEPSFVRNTSSVGHSLFVAYDDVVGGPLRLRFEFGFETYRFSARYNQTIGMTKRVLEIKANTSQLMFGFYFFNKPITNRIKFGAGFQYNQLLRTKATGFYTQAGPDTQFNELTILSGRTRNLTTKVQFGVVLRLASHLDLGDRLRAVPQYKYYYGFTDSFKKYIPDANVAQHFLGIGLSWKLSTSQ